MTKMPPPSIAVPFVTEPSIQMVRRYELQSLAPMFCLSLLHLTTPSISTTWFPAVTICFLLFVSGIQRDFSMVLSSVSLVATVLRSSSA